MNLNFECTNYNHFRKCNYYLVLLSELEFLLSISYHFLPMSGSNFRFFSTTVVLLNFVLSVSFLCLSQRLRLTFALILLFSDSFSSFSSLSLFLFLFVINLMTSITLEINPGTKDIQVNNKLTIINTITPHPNISI